MGIVLIAVIGIGILDYLLLMPGRRDKRDDEEQIQYLKDWKKDMENKQIITGYDKSFKFCEVHEFWDKR